MNNIKNKLESLKNDVENIKYIPIIVEALSILNIDEEIMNEFDMSRPTLNRWKLGQNAPHPAIRKHILTFLIKKL